MKIQLSWRFYFRKGEIFLVLLTLPFYLYFSFYQFKNLYWSLGLAFTLCVLNYIVFLATHSVIINRIHLSRQELKVEIFIFGMICLLCSLSLLYFGAYSYFVLFSFFSLYLYLQCHFYKRTIIFYVGFLALAFLVYFAFTFLFLLSLQLFVIWF